ncbi:HAD-IIB family hydrolase [Pirellulaceae bacterium SH449]
MNTLATDLDGTFIPFEFTDQPKTQCVSDRSETTKAVSTSLEEQKIALQRLSLLHAQGAFQLIYITGRDEQSVMQCMSDEQLPSPEFIFCDVGTTLLQRTSGFDQDSQAPTIYERVTAYHKELEAITSGLLARDLGGTLPAMPKTQLQESHKQGIFKRSYYCQQQDLDDVTMLIRRHLAKGNLPYQVIGSIDPFNGDGLIDLLPAGTNKGFALKWWTSSFKMPWDSVVFAGDSGNDMAAFKTGVRSIVVGNAPQPVIKEIRDYHQSCGTMSNLFLTQRFATAGVWDGSIHFGLIEPDQVDL